MNSFIVAVAQYLLFVILATAGIIWLCLPRRDKVGLAFQAIVSLVIAVVMIGVAAAIHTDPRPFVVDPSISPLFAHSADNGSRRAWRHPLLTGVRIRSRQVFVFTT